MLVIIPINYTNTSEKQDSTSPTMKATHQLWAQMSYTDYAKT